MRSSLCVLHAVYTLSCIPSCTPLRRGVRAARRPHEPEVFVRFEPTQSLSFHHGRPGTVDAVGTDESTHNGLFVDPPGPGVPPLFLNLLPQRRPRGLTRCLLSSARSFTSPRPPPSTTERK